MPRRGQGSIGSRRVLRARVPGHVAQLHRNLERVGGHVHPGEQRGHVGIQVDVGPQRAGFTGGHQLIALGRRGAVHGGLQIGLPLFQRAWIDVAGFAQLSGQDAADAGQVQLIHPPILAEGHTNPVGAGAPVAVTCQQRHPVSISLPFHHVAHGPLEAVHFLLQRWYFGVQSLTVELPHLRHLVLDGFPTPKLKAS